MKIQRTGVREADSTDTRVKYSKRHVSYTDKKIEKFSLGNIFVLFTLLTLLLYYQTYNKIQIMYFQEVPKSKECLYGYGSIPYNDDVVYATPSTVRKLESELKAKNTKKTLKQDRISGSKSTRCHLLESNYAIYFPEYGPAIPKTPKSRREISMII